MFAQSAGPSRWASAREQTQGREGLRPEAVRARRATDQGARIHEDGTPAARDPPEGTEGLARQASIPIRPY